MNSNKQIMCQKCDGRGFTHRMEYVDCVGCNGRKVVDYGNIIGTCNLCGGVGKTWKQIRVICDMCHGKSMTKY
jgi:DnaJ-class molecular chaperone